MFNMDISSQLNNVKREVCHLSCVCPVWRRGSLEGYNPSCYGISSSQHQPRVKTLDANLSADPPDHHVGSFTGEKKTVS